MIKIPDVGLMRHRITVQSITRLPGPTGQLNGVWTDIGIYWGHLEPVGGHQQFVAMQVKPTVWFRVRLRTNIQITVIANRLKFQDRFLNIESVYRTDERPGYYEVTCTELKKV